MRHILLTLAVYNPEAWTLERNHHRLHYFRHVTVPSLASQTTKDWQWRIMLHPNDPLREERVNEAKAAGVEVQPVLWPYGDPKDQHIFAALTNSENYWDLGGEHLTTRIDDDDAFAPFALERIQQTRGKVVIFSSGIYVSRLGYTPMRNPRIAFGSIRGRNGYCATSFPHREILEQGPHSEINGCGWMYTIHQDSATIRRGTQHKLRGRTWRPLDDLAKGRFSIHWDELWPEQSS